MIITFYQHYVDKQGKSKVEVGVEAHEKLITWFLKRITRADSSAKAETVLYDFFASLNDYEKVRTN